jgi:hypothetical protein
MAGAAVLAIFILSLGTQADAAVRRTRAVKPCRKNCKVVDTTSPSVTVNSPAAASSVSDVVSVAGLASDNVGVSRVDVQVDAGTAQAAVGTTAWAYSLDTRSITDGSHTITVRAVDAAGNATSAAVSVTVANAAPASSPQHLVTPEGAVIDINSAGSWKAEDIYRMLKENGLDSVIGRTLTVKVQDVYPSQAATAASTSNGVYTSFQAVLYLKGVESTFVTQPDAVLAHEFGHVWTLYHLYITHQGDWTSYRNARGLAGDPRVDGSYVWYLPEIIAEDYRLLFGSPAAIAQRPTHMNPDIPEPGDVVGLREFLAGPWAGR